MVLLVALLSFYLGLSAGLATLGGYFWKQFSVFNHRKIKFMQRLSESLYYKALDNNMGVFHYLIDNAKESEGEELIIAWRFIQQLQQTSAKELDQAIERYFGEQLDTIVNFDVNDALHQLVRLALVDVEGGIYHAKAPAVSLQHLGEQWLNKGII